MHYYPFNLLRAVREAASRLEGEFTCREVCRLVADEHPEFDAGDTHIVGYYLNLLARQGRLVRVRGADRGAHTPGVFRNAGDTD